MSPLFPLTLALYAVACALYLSHFASPGESMAKMARAALIAAFAAHAVDIGVLCVHGLHPFVNARESFAFAAWLTVGAYLLLSLRFRVPILGALIVPVTIVLLVAARVLPSPAGPAVGLLQGLHIGLATAGVALFAVAAGGAALFLMAEWQLKQHKPGKALRKGPSLDTLDKINRASILLGFPLFTVAMVLGALLAVHRPDGGAHRLLQPAYLLSTVTWGLYAALVVARVTGGWRGRRAALVTLAGFGAAVCVLLIYYSHGFGVRA